MLMRQGKNMEIFLAKSPSPRTARLECYPVPRSITSGQKWSWTLCNRHISWRREIHNLVGDIFAFMSHRLMHSPTNWTSQILVPFFLLANPSSLTITCLQSIKLFGLPASGCPLLTNPLPTSSSPFEKRNLIKNEKWVTPLPLLQERENFSCPFLLCSSTFSSTAFHLRWPQKREKSAVVKGGPVSLHAVFSLFIIFGGLNVGQMDRMKMAELVLLIPIFVFAWSRFSHLEVKSVIMQISFKIIIIYYFMCLYYLT